MKMAYIAIDPETNHCFGICSASPDFIEEAAKDVKKWKKQGARIELVPKNEAIDKFGTDV